MSNLRSNIILRDLETREQVDLVIIELRRRRVGYRAIGETLGVMAGLHLTEGQVRYRARRKLGLPPGVTRNDQRPWEKT